MDKRVNQVYLVNPSIQAIPKVYFRSRLCLFSFRLLALVPQVGAYTVKRYSGGAIGRSSIAVLRVGSALTSGALLRAVGGVGVKSDR